MFSVEIKLPKYKQNNKNDARTNLSLQVVENVRSNLNQNIYNAIVPRNVRLAEAPSHGLPISLSDLKSNY